MSIELKYKCLCMATEASIHVVERDPAGDPVEWMRTIVEPSISYDHIRRSPKCRRAKMEYAKIPIDPISESFGTKTRPS